AEENGVQQKFWDNFGEPHVTEPATNAAILTALGLDCTSEQALEASLRNAPGSGGIPPVLVLPEGEPIPFEGVIEPEDGGKLSDGPLRPGYYTLRTASRTVRLIVAPNTARRMEQKRAGLGVTLYGVRSARNWGCGDFRDLRDLVDWAVPAIGADF